MVKVLLGGKVIKVNSLNDLDLEALVAHCKSYNDDGDGNILAISPATPRQKELYKEEYGEDVDYIIVYGEYLD